jgi:hypothetical protein
MARIWKVWVFHMMTDAYGDIPYFESAKDVQNVINQPKYDTQELIYRDMLNELKEAAAQLGSQQNQISFGNADILYQGNVDSWEKFANSLRLRLAIRVRFADALLLQSISMMLLMLLLLMKIAKTLLESTMQPSATENSDNVNFCIIEI